MGEIAEMMLTGILCAMCGSALNCEVCSETEIPIYCSSGCAKDQGAGEAQVCHHND